MGSDYQAIIDIEANEAEAQVFADKIRDWLISESLIDSRLENCVLGKDAGYPPGPKYKAVVKPHDFDIRELRTNGLQINIGREFYFAGQGGYFEIVCPICYEQVLTEDVTGFWGAMDSLFKGQNNIFLTCPNCNKITSFSQWRYAPGDGIGRLVAGNLAFKFWNWPIFKVEFLQRFEKQLGHEISYVFGKL